MLSLRYRVAAAALNDESLRPLLLSALREATPRYRDYVRRYKGPGNPMNKEDWEAKVLPKKKD